MPLSTHLAKRVRDMMCDPAKWNEFPPQVREWLELQQQFSVLPTPNKLLIETFPRGAKHYLVAYCFEGRLAHSTLGMLLTKRMERLGLGPIGTSALTRVLCLVSPSG